MDFLLNKLSYSVYCPFISKNPLFMSFLPVFLLGLNLSSVFLIQIPQFTSVQIIIGTSALVVLISLLILLLRRRGKEYDTEEDADPLYYLGNQRLMTSFYAGGHPEIDEMIRPCVIYVSGDSLSIGLINNENENLVRTMGQIPLDEIQGIRVVDSFNFRYKSEKNDLDNSMKFIRQLDFEEIPDLAFVTIEWKAQGQVCRTHFGIISQDAMHYALIIRNELRKWWKREEVQSEAAFI